MKQDKKEVDVVGELIKTVKLLNSKLIDLDSRICEVEGIKNPLTLEGRLASIFGQIEELTDKVAIVMRKMSAYDFDERFLEIFTDEEINAFYEKSGLTMHEVKNFISNKYFNGEKVSIQTASNYVNGKVTDLKTRSSLGKYLRHYVAQK